MSVIAERAGVVRHLAGKHDQKAHAGSRGSASGVGTVDDGMPEGWTTSGPGQYDNSVRARKGDVYVAVPLDSFEYTGIGEDFDARHNSREEQQEHAERAAVAVARSVDPLIAAYPDEFGAGASHSVMIEVVRRGDPTSDIGSGVTAGTTRRALGGKQSIVNLRSDLFAPGRGDVGKSLVTSDGDGGVMSRHNVGEMGYLMQHSGRPRSSGFHGESDWIDPVRATITHEMGHAFDTFRSGGVEDLGVASVHQPGFPSDRSQWSASRTAGYDMTHVTTDAGVSSPDQAWDIYETTSGYGRTNPAEMYAEGFAEWHMRDIAEPSASAQWLAEHEGWEGA